uniref:Uncharacterized protein n=1 Tax=Anguilla anguilla TaxID=7936 RepID=A0A0E9Y0X8_ANGAN
MVCSSAYHKKACLLQHYSIAQYDCFFCNSVNTLVTALSVFFPCLMALSRHCSFLGSSFSLFNSFSNFCISFFSIVVRSSIEKLFLKLLHFSACSLALLSFVLSIF